MTRFLFILVTTEAFMEMSQNLSDASDKFSLVAGKTSPRGLFNKTQVKVNKQTAATLKEWQREAVPKGPALI